MAAPYNSISPASAAGIYFIQPTDQDARVEQGTSFKDTEVNRRYRADIHEWKLAYRAAMNDKSFTPDKAIIIETIKQNLAARNSRLLRHTGQQNAGCWFQAVDGNLTRTISDALRAATREKKIKSPRKKRRTLTPIDQDDDEFQNLLDDMFADDETTLNDAPPSSQDAAEPILSSQQPLVMTAIEPPPPLPDYLSAISDSFFTLALAKMETKLLNQENHQQLVGVVAAM